jgi:hypothetical protein
MSAHQSDRALTLASDLAPAIGGGYFNPVGDLAEVSRQLWIDHSSVSDVGQMNLEEAAAPTYVVTHLYLQLTAQLAPQELLFAVYERPSYMMAPYIYDPQRLSDFERQVADRILVRRCFYAVPHDLADQGLRRESPRPRMNEKLPSSP